MTHSPNGHIRLNIEALRAIAVLMTVVNHIEGLFFWGSQRVTDVVRGPFTWWVGVDIFFVISGFLIGSNLLRMKAQTTHERSFASFVIPFYIRRIWRIWPSAWLWLIVAVAASAFFNRSGVFLTLYGNLSDAAAGVLQVANLHFWHCYSTPGHECGVSGVYWSLSSEEQFYIVLPLLIFFATKRTVIAVLIASILLQIFIARPVLSLPWYVRTDALSIGVLLAFWNEWKPIRATTSLTLGQLTYPILVALCVVVASVPHLTGDRTFTVSAIAFASGFVVYVALKLENGHQGRLATRLFGYFGSRSFSIYLIHVLAYFGTREIWLRITHGSSQFDSHFTLRFALTAAVLTFALAEANYRVVETPLRRYGVRTAARWRQKRSMRLAAH